MNEGLKEGIMIVSQCVKHSLSETDHHSSLFILFICSDTPSIRMNTMLYLDLYISTHVMLGRSIGERETERPEYVDFVIPCYTAYFIILTSLDFSSS